MKYDELLLLLMSLAMLVALAMVWSHLIGKNKPYEGNCGWPLEKKDEKKGEGE